MNTTNTEMNNATCCVDYCKTEFNIAGRTITNTYKCGQTGFTPAQLERIHKEKKTATRRRNTTV